MSSAFTIYVDDNSERYLMHRTTEGKTAVLLFRTRDAAQAYVDGKNHIDPLIVREITNADHVAEWLRGALTQNGATEIAIDPDPSTSSGLSSTPVIPIAAYLIQLELNS